MISQRAELPVLALSVKVYRVLLLAYPAKFQQEYGADMVQVFRDCCLRTLRENGANGMVRLWTATLFDLVQSVVSEHAQKEIEMKREMNPEDIRMAGWALIWGAVTFAIGMLSQLIGGPDFWGIGTALVILLSLPLLVIGVLGMRRRYGDKVGRFGKNILLTGVILGSLIPVIGIAAGLAGFFTEDSGWIVPYLGLSVLLACLTLFGVVALYKRPLSRWNGVPIIAGVWFPILSLFWFLRLTNPGAWEGGLEIPDSFSIVFLTIQSIALAAQGYILKSDVPEERVIAA